MTRLLTLDLTARTVQMPVKGLALIHAKVLVRQHAGRFATGLVKHIVKHIVLLAVKTVVKIHALATVLIRAKVIVRVLQDK